MFKDNMFDEVVSLSSTLDISLSKNIDTNNFGTLEILFLKSLRPKTRWTRNLTTEDKWSLLTTSSKCSILGKKVHNVALTSSKHS